MFYSYNLKTFGEEIRKIRKKCGFSQADVSMQTGINQDTLRKIEQGYVIPKYETLEILSVSYKFDLLRLLQSFRINKYYYEYYQTIDKIISNNEFILLDNVISSFEKVECNKSLSSQLINQKELQQFHLFINGMKEYYNNIYNNIEKAELLLTNALKLTIKEFKIKNFKDFRYSFFEIRILLLLGLVEEKKQNTLISTDILSFILNFLLSSPTMDMDIQNLILKIYANISYNYHRIDQHNFALIFANEGIDYAVENSNMHCLYLLFARKGIAQFFLGYKDYVDTLKKSIQLLEINNQFELSKLYKEIIQNKYNIIL